MFKQKITHKFETKQNTIDTIIWECRNHELGLKSQIAYVLATVEHETANTFKPVKEAYWLDENWRKNNLRYYPFYGRGYVQLTWKENYQKYSKILGADLVKNPDILLEPNVSLFILVHGCRHGSFTGKKIPDYLSYDKKDYFNARRVINGTDKAELIANLAKKWETIL